MQTIGESTVKLVDFMGGDHQTINSARVSFDKDVRAEVERVYGADECAKPLARGPMSKRDEGLIRFLLRKRHGTPFESTVMTFYVHTPIFVAREWFRHRIGSFNEMSGRYTKLKTEFFLPTKARTQTGKPGAYLFEKMATEDDEYMRGILSEVYEHMEDAYHLLLDRGIAKEQARLALGVSLMTKFYWTVNGRSLMNFLELRLSSEAMQEIRLPAEDVHSCFQMVSPVVCSTFDDYGKAP